MKIITNICLLLILVAGYQDQVPTMSAAPTEISGRLDAALAMKNNTARHNTLVQVGQDAAEAGEGDVVLKVIGLIDAGSSHDNLCSMCSKSLARKGKISEATAVANQLANDTARNNLLSEIATGVKDWQY